MRRANEGGEGGEDGLDASLGRATATARTGTTPFLPRDKEKMIGVPFAEELFGLEESELLGRGKKDAEKKRELALEKCVRSCLVHLHLRGTKFTTKESTKCGKTLEVTYVRSCFDGGSLHLDYALPQHVRLCLRFGGIQRCLSERKAKKPVQLGRKHGTGTWKAEGVELRLRV